MKQVVLLHWRDLYRLRTRLDSGHQTSSARNLYDHLMNPKSGLFFRTFVLIFSFLWAPRNISLIEQHSRCITDI